MRADRWFLPVGLLIVLLPFVIPVFPSQDGPSHLDTIRVLGLLEASAPNVGSVYEAVAPGISNAVAPWMLGVLANVTTPALAEWSLALLSTIVLLAVIVFPVVALRRDTKYAILALPLAIPLMLYMGSISLVLGFSPAFLSMATALLYLRTRDVRYLLSTSILQILSFIVQAQLAAGLIVAVLGGAAGVFALAIVQRRDIGALRPLALLCLAALPAAVCLIVYQAQFSASTVSGAAMWHLSRLIDFVTEREDIARFSHFDRIPYLLASLLTLGIVLVWLHKRVIRNDVAFSDLSTDFAFASAVSVFVLVVVLPVDTTSVPLIPLRILPIAHFCLYLWMLSAIPKLSFINSLVWVMFGAVCVTGAFRLLVHRDLADDIAQLRAVEQSVPDGAVVLAYDLPMLDHARREVKFNPVLHLGRYFGRRDIVSPDNYQAQARTPFFRIRYRNDWDGTQPISEPNSYVTAHPSVEALDAWAADFEAAFGRRVSHAIMRSGQGGAPVSTPAAQAASQFVAGRFTKVMESSDGTVSLWERK